MPSALTDISGQRQYHRDGQSSVKLLDEPVLKLDSTPTRAESIPYKVNKILSAGKKILELKSFVPPENIWVSGIGTSKSSRNYYPPSEFSFDNANKLLQKLRDLSNQVLF